MTDYSLQQLMFLVHAGNVEKIKKPRCSPEIWELPPPPASRVRGGRSPHPGFRRPCLATWRRITLMTSCTAALMRSISARGKLSRCWLNETSQIALAPCCRVPGLVRLQYGRQRLHVTPTCVPFSHPWVSGGFTHWKLIVTHLPLL